MSVIDDCVLRTLEHHLNQGVDPTLVVESGLVTWASDSLEGMLGVSAQEALGHDLEHVLGGCVAGVSTSVVAVATHATRKVSTEVEARSLKGQLLLEVTTTPVPGSGSTWVVTLAPSQAPESLNAALRAAQERFSALSARAPIAIFASDVGLRLDHVNDAFCELFGATEEELLGAAWLGRLEPEALTACVDALGDVLQGRSCEWRMRIEHTDGSLREVIGRAAPVDERGRAGTFVGTLEDVTERYAHESQLEYAAKHDALTGLANRAEMDVVLANMLDSSEPGDVAVLFLDLDEFKVVNDTLGHSKGDELLLAVARQVKACTRAGDLVARFGGDEFVVARTGAGREELEELAEDLVRSVRSSVSGLDLGAVVSTSVGMVVSGAGSSAEDLVREADVAMYQAKAAGKDRWCFLDAGMAATAADEVGLLKDLRTALANGSLAVHYQPVTAMGDGRLVAVEALARWEHPRRGMVGPEVFVGLAERAGLVGELGTQVLEHACATLKDLKVRLGSAAPEAVSVNVSSRQLGSALVGLVVSALTRHGLTGAELCLEITESAVMEDPVRAVETLQALRALGVKLALDDFGTGHSSLSYLRDLPVTVVKLDRSFIERLGSGAHPASERDAHVVQAVLGLSRSLNLRVVAEGVETADQLAVLDGLDALSRAAEGAAGDAEPLLIQGWLRARAMTPAALVEWAEARVLTSA